jgi:hypothetical protein
MAGGLEGDGARQRHRHLTRAISHSMVDAKRAPTLMAGLVRGEIPELELRAFDEIDWTRWHRPD